MYAPVRSIAEASTTGHGTNIITGVAVGMKSTVIPCITVSVAVISAFHLGKSSGVGEGRNAGLFGTAVATMGMLSSAVYVLSMNNFGEEEERFGLAIVGSAARWGGGGRGIGGGSGGGGAGRGEREKGGRGGGFGWVGEAGRGWEQEGGGLKEWC